MRFNKIRAISWLLVLVMVFGLLPFGAMAQQSEEPAPPMTEEPSVPTTIVEPADPAVPTEPIPEAPKTFSFTLIGKTVTGEPLNGAGYTLFTAKDAQDAELTKKVGEEGITNAETGEISFKDLPVGTYHLEETTVPENNQKTEDILFTLDDTGKINLLSPESTTEKVLLDVEKKHFDLAVRSNTAAGGTANGKGSHTARSNDFFNSGGAEPERDQLHRAIRRGRRNPRGFRRDGDFNQSEARHLFPGGARSKP